MGLIPLGILSSAGGGFGTYELIETQILGSSTASITFSGLATYASVYKHLQVRATLRTTRAATGEVFIMRFNADTGTNYSWHLLEGNGSTVISAAGTTQDYMRAAVGVGASGTTNGFGAAVIDIVDAYATTKNKTIRSLSGQATNTNFIDLFSGSWRNTNAITSVTVAPLSTTDLAANSRFSIYGIR
jgi:hypothetical protein